MALCRQWRADIVPSPTRSMEEFNFRIICCYFHPDADTCIYIFHSGHTSHGCFLAIFAANDIIQYITLWNGVQAFVSIFVTIDHLFPWGIVIHIETIVELRRNWSRNTKKKMPCAHLRSANNRRLNRNNGFFSFHFGNFVMCTNSVIKYVCIYVASRVRIILEYS